MCEELLEADRLDEVEFTKLPKNDMMMGFLQKAERVQRNVESRRRDAIP
jgi:hypothetical protein